MAAVAASSTLSQWLPLAGAGALAYVLARQSNSALPVGEKSVEQRMNDDHRLDLETWGLSSTAFQQLHDKSMLAGAPLHEEMFLSNEGGGYQKNKNIDLVDRLRDDHVRLNHWDRSVQYYTIGVSQEGFIRPRKRVPVVAALSREISHPNDSSRVSLLEAYKLVPNYANPQQIRQAAAEHDRMDRSDQRLQRHYDSQFFSRAPGQSFRYE